MSYKGIHKINFLIIFVVVAFFSCQKDEIEEEITVVDQNPQVTQKNLPSRFQYFYKGRSSGKIYSSYNTTGSGSWAGDFSLTNGARTKSGVAATKFGNKLVIAHKGEKSNKIYSSYSSNGKNFAGNKSIPGAKTKITPKLVSKGDSLFMYHKGERTNHIFYNISENGTTWNANKRLPLSSNIYANNFDFTFFDDKMYFMKPFTSRQNNGTTLVGIQYISSDDGVNFSNNFVNIPDVTQIYYNYSFSTISSISSTVMNGRLYILYTLSPSGSSSKSMYVTSTADFNSFTRPTQIRVYGNTALTSEKPSIASNGNRLVVAFKANSKDNIYYAYSSDGVSWLGNRAAKGATKGEVNITYTN